MTTAQVVETSVTVNKNSPIQDHVHPDDQTQPTFETVLFCHVLFLIEEQSEKSNVKSSKYLMLIIINSK